MKTILAVCFLAAPLFAQTATAPPTPGLRWEQLVGYVPASSTAITTADSLLSQLYLANVSGSSVTVTLTDISTACSSGPCSFWPAVTIAANTVYIANFGGILHTVGGVKWSASTGSAVLGWMGGTYTQVQIAEMKFQHHHKVGGFLALLHLRHPGTSVIDNTAPEMSPEKFLALVAAFPK